MRQVGKKKIYICFLSGVLLLVGCGSSNTPTEKTVEKKVQVNNGPAENKSDSSKTVDYDQLRKKANVAEAASMVGYDGKAIKKDLNKIIDEREKMDKQLNDLGL